MPLALYSTDEMPAPANMQRHDLSAASTLNQTDAACATEAHPLSREETLNALLALYDQEEARRQKCLARSKVLVFTVFAAQIVVGGLMACCQYFPSVFASPQTLQMIKSSLSITPVLFSAFFLFHNLKWNGRGFSDLLNPDDTVNKARRTPLYSSRIQQDVIATLLNYADSPRVAEPLCRALTYYIGDKNVLYLRLARVLPLLPNDKEALSPIAHKILRSYARAAFEPSDKTEESTRPVLINAARAYFARIGEPVLPPTKKGRKKRHA